MNTINIFEILKHVPIGTKLYSPNIGECTLKKLNPFGQYIVVSSSENNIYCFSQFGQYLVLSKDLKNAECMLFPSKENRDWNKFKQSFEQPLLSQCSTEKLRAELKRRNAEEKAIRQKEFNDAHRCRNCKYFKKDSFLSNHYTCAVRTWGKTTKRHYVVNGSHGLQCNHFVHK